MRDDLDNMKVQVRDTIEKMQSLRPKWYWPLSWFKALRYQNKIITDLVALVADCVESNHTVAGAMETNAAVDTDLSQQIKRVWKEFYTMEKNGKLFETRLEAVERNSASPPHPVEDPKSKEEKES